MTKTYIFSDGKKAAFEYDENGVGKITLECMNMLMGQLIAYKWCIQSRSFWDSKHCDGCMFYDDCPFDPREDEDEPQTDMAEDIVRSFGFKTESYRQAKAKDEPQTDCPWK